MGLYLKECLKNMHLNKFNDPEAISQVNAKKLREQRKTNRFNYVMSKRGFSQVDGDAEAPSPQKGKEGRLERVEHLLIA